MPDSTSEADAVAVPPSPATTVTAYFVTGITGSEPLFFLIVTVKLSTVINCCPTEDASKVNEVDCAFNPEALKYWSSVTVGVFVVVPFDIVTCPLWLTQYVIL